MVLLHRPPRLLIFDSGMSGAYRQEHVYFHRLGSCLDNRYEGREHIDDARKAEPYVMMLEFKCQSKLCCQARGTEL